MRDLLKKGYTIYISKKGDSINGIGLRKLENGKGIGTYELDGSKLKVLGELSGINQKLTAGETLQLSREYENVGIKYKAQFGVQVGKGPYGENDCLEVSTEVEDEEFLGALILLNEASRTDDKITPPKVLIRKYGEVTYK